VEPVFCGSENSQRDHGPGVVENDKVVVSCQPRDGEGEGGGRNEGQSGGGGVLIPDKNG